MLVLGSRVTGWGVKGWCWIARAMARGCGLVQPSSPGLAWPGHALVLEGLDVTSGSCLN